MRVCIGQTGRLLQLRDMGCEDVDVARGGQVRWLSAVVWTRAPTAGDTRCGVGLLDHDVCAGS